MGHANRSSTSVTGGILAPEIHAEWNRGIQVCCGLAASRCSPEKARQGRVNMKHPSLPNDTNGFGDWMNLPAVGNCFYVLGPSQQQQSSRAATPAETRRSESKSSLCLMRPGCDPGPAHDLCCELLQVSESDDCASLSFLSHFPFLTSLLHVSSFSH